jgi:TPR repeat protein
MLLAIVLLTSQAGAQHFPFVVGTSHGNELKIVSNETGSQYQNSIQTNTWVTRKNTLNKRIDIASVEPTVNADEQKLNNEDNAKSDNSTNAVNARLDKAMQAALAGDAWAAANLCISQLGAERIRWCELASKLGDFDAPYFLADEYANGWHVTKDQSLATHWYEVSAERGYSISAILAGIHYFYGIGVAQDDRQAKKWFERALKIGNKRAGYYWLGILYEFAHDDKKKDYKEIVKLYERALQPRSDNRDLYFRLGFLYAKGLGVARDPVKAHEFFKESEQLTYLQSPLLGSYFLGMGTERSSAGRPKYDDEARLIKDAMRLSSSQKGGAPSGENMLGLAYFDGIGVEKDVAKSLVWFRLAATHGYTAAYFNTGEMYMHGVGAEKNLQTAKFWLERGSSSGDNRATFVLGVLYLNNGKIDEVGTDPDEGIQLIKKAAEQGDVEAQNLLAIYYALGRYVPQDIDLAEMWWERSKERGAELMRQNKSIYEYNGG